MHISIFVPVPVFDPPPQQPVPSTTTREPPPTGTTNGIETTTKKREGTVCRVKSATIELAFKGEGKMRGGGRSAGGGERVFSFVITHRHKPACVGLVVSRRPFPHSPPRAMKRRRRASKWDLSKARNYFGRGKPQP